MTPNWKQCAKHAFNLGRESARREQAEWIPARDPPESPGRVFVITRSILGDGEITDRVEPAVFDGHFITMYERSAVLFWTPIPEAPPGVNPVV